ncbi:hypothetical protein PG991_014672 [Apiospora marii]|uniref:Uncharacterized protein n=1 Tax=Apiospora marii TaxID=335849 RepID=A0ABR1R4D2_9PEZI
MALIQIPEALPKGRKETSRTKANITPPATILPRAIAIAAVAVAVFIPCFIYAIPLFTSRPIVSVPDILVRGSSYTGCALYSGFLECPVMVVVASMNVYALFAASALVAVAIQLSVYGWARAYLVGHSLFWMNVLCCVVSLLLTREVRACHG